MASAFQAGDRGFESHQVLQFKDTMKFCGVCEKEVETKFKVTSPRFWCKAPNEYTYERDVCVHCGTELLINIEDLWDGGEIGIHGDGTVSDTQETSAEGH